MVYSLKDYRINYYPNVSQSTVLRMVHRGCLPSNHKIIYGRKIVIEIQGVDDNLSSYFDASVEFNERKKNLYDTTIFELAAEISIKHNLSITKFFKFHGL